MKMCPNAAQAEHLARTKGGTAVTYLVGDEGATQRRWSVLTDAELARWVDGGAAFERLEVRP